MTEVYKPDGTVSEEPDPPKQAYVPSPTSAPAQRPEPTADRILRHLSPVWLIVGYCVVFALYPWMTTGFAIFAINMVFWVIVAVVGSVMRSRPIRSIAIGALLSIASLALLMLLVFGACFVLAGGGG